MGIEFFMGLEAVRQIVWDDRALLLSSEGTLARFVAVGLRQVLTYENFRRLSRCCRWDSRRPFCLDGPLLRFRQVGGKYRGVGLLDLRVDVHRFVIHQRVS